MECFKSALDKLKKDVNKKMGNMPPFKCSRKKFEKVPEEPKISKNNDSLLPDWMEAKVAMDYTSGTAKIITEAELKSEKKAGTSPQIRRLAIYDHPPLDILNYGRHLTQKYYHPDMSKEEAHQILLRSEEDGTWLLRKSEARKGNLVIVLRHNLKIRNYMIHPALYKDKLNNKEIVVVTVDEQLAFYDVHSLIEYYKLNKGVPFECLLGKSYKNPKQRENTPPRRLVSDVSSAGPSRASTQATQARQPATPTRVPGVAKRRPVKSTESKETESFL